MAENARKPRKNINVPCLVLAIVFCLALIASICTYFYAASGTEIFTKVGFGATLQNSRIMADDENDMTFLGTYANTIIGVDAEGNHVWTQPISGAVGAMEYDTDNDWLVVGSQDRNVYVFNSLTGELLMQYPVNGKVDDLDYDQASKQILVSSGVSATKHTLAVLNLETGEELFSLSLRNTASAAQFSPDLQYIYYGVWLIAKIRSGSQSDFRSGSGGRRPLPGRFRRWQMDWRGHPRGRRAPAQQRGRNPLFPQTAIRYFADLFRR